MRCNTRVLANDKSGDLEHFSAQALSNANDWPHNTSLRNVFDSPCSVLAVTVEEYFADVATGSCPHQSDEEKS